MMRLFYGAFLASCTTFGAASSTSRRAPDGLKAASTSGSGAVVWDARTGQKVIRLEYPVDELAPIFRSYLNGRAFDQRRLKTVTCVAFAPDGQTLVSGSKDCEVRVWDRASKRAKSSLKWKIGEVWAVAVAPDGMTAAAGGESGDIIVWDLED